MSNLINIKTLMYKLLISLEALTILKKKISISPYKSKLVGFSALRPYCSLSHYRFMNPGETRRVLTPLY